MTRRSVVTAAVVAAVLVAGCSLPLSGDQQPTVTPAPVPTPDAQVDEQVHPPGIVDDEITSAAAVARKHRLALENRSYRVREESVRILEGPEVQNTRVEEYATTRYRGDGVVSHERQQLLIQTEPTQDRTWTNTTTYTTGDERFVRTRTDGTTNYSVVPATAPTTRVRQNTTLTVEQVLALENATVEPVVWNGNPYYLVTGRGAASNVFSLTNDYTVRAVIEKDGLVRQLSVSYNESLIGRERRIEYTVSIDPIQPETVEQPDWIEAARANVTTTP